MIEDFLWALNVASAYSLLLPLLGQIAVCIVVYQFDYAYQLFSFFFARVFGKRDGFAKKPMGSRPPILVVLPTLLRSKDDLESLKDSMVSAAENEYPGKMIIIAGIDDRCAAVQLFASLERWAEEYAWPSNVTVRVTGTDRRTGKALAVERAVALAKKMVKKGELSELPGIFFNMDADSTLGATAIERMVHKLEKRNRFTGQKAYIVSSNVAMRHDHYWRGWRWFFSVEGQIAIQIAREFMVTSGLGRFNSKLQPVVGVPGALYCTWTELYLEGPRYGAFARTLTFGHFVKWWLGFAPPRYSETTVEPLPEAMTGPGDDTWVAWLAGTARWENDRLTFDAPRTPLHAFYYLLRSYFVQRTVSYDLDARVFTVSPTKPKALFRQRVRWNACRPDTLGRWRTSMMFHWSIGLPAAAQLVTTLVIVGSILGAMFALPLMTGHFNDLVVAYVLGSVAHFFLFGVSSSIALMLEGDVARNWRKLLAVPLAPLYFTIFNMWPCIYGLVCDLFLFGNWTNFSPEQTLIRSKTTRVALLFRLRRAFLLAVRAVVRGDVPFGTFWFGWRETPWTPNGFEGWTSGKKARSILGSELRPFDEIEPSPVSEALARRAATMRPTSGA